MKQKYLTSEQILSLDAYAIKNLAIPSICLMENAGRASAYEILRSLKNIKSPKVSVFCGTGNNGGDGFVVSRHLINNGVKIGVYLAGEEKSLKPDAVLNYSILKNMGVEIKNLACVDGRLRANIAKADCVVDALFGIGLSRGLQEPFLSLISLINGCARKVFSIDVPSGLNATTGEVYGECIKADKTITFSFPKTGFIRNYGRKYCGEVIVADIGIPPALINSRVIKR